MHDAASKSTWTGERIDELRVLYAQGLSCSQIAAKLGGGLTRNSVIGKIHRLGLQRRGPTPSPQRAERIVRPQRSKRFRDEQPSAPKRERSDVPVPPSPPPAEPAVPSGAVGVEMDGLTRRTCRWPLWAHPDEQPKFYCGDPSADLDDDRPYCPYHSNVVRSGYQPRGKDVAPLTWR